MEKFEELAKELYDLGTSFTFDSKEFKVCMSSFSSKLLNDKFNEILEKYDIKESVKREDGKWHRTYVYVMCKDYLLHVLFEQSKMKFNLSMWGIK
jgi:hypothetical protein